MSFSFGFFDAEAEATVEDPASPLSTGVLPAQVVPAPSSWQQQGFAVVLELETEAGSVVLKRTTREPSTLPEGYLATHDVVPRKYEGGFKIWECSLDLVKVLCDSRLLRLFAVSSPPTTVLELGCGQGFPGIAVLKCLPQPCRVVFSDLNAEVLQETTWPNILLNCPERAGDVTCVAGDWSALPESASLGGPFDLVVSAETLYTAESCRGVLAALQRFLAPGGVALIATKRFYFGLGGGTRELEQLVLSSSSNEGGQGGWSCSLLTSYEDGQSNIRDVVCISRGRGE